LRGDDSKKQASESDDEVEKEGKQAKYYVERWDVNKGSWSWDETVGG
jgi:hypothetical protein